MLEPFDANAVARQNRAVAEAAREFRRRLNVGADLSEAVAFLKDRDEAARAPLVAQVAALRPYLQHATSCPSEITPVGERRANRCDCGLRVLLTEVRTATKAVVALREKLRMAREALEMTRQDAAMFFSLLGFEEKNRSAEARRLRIIRDRAFRALAALAEEATDA